MTSIVVASPARSSRADLVRGFVGGWLGGAAPTMIFVGLMMESWPLVFGSVILPVVYGVLIYRAGAPRRAREAAVTPVTALAVIESLQAVGGEVSADVPIAFDLTVAPDDAPAFRVKATERINLVDVPDYRPGGILVVEYPPNRPWRAKHVKEPTLEWRRRADSALIDSAPESTRMEEPPGSDAKDGMGCGGFLTGVAVVLLLFGVGFLDPFDHRSERDTGKPPATSSPSPSSLSSPSSSSTNTTTKVSSASGTVVLGSGKSFLDEGQLRQAVKSLTKGGEKGPALTVVVQDSRLSVVFPPTGTQVSLFDPDFLPYGRIPALVKEATTTLGIDSPSWQLTADRLTGSLNLRVTVTGLDGDTASLIADAEGKVILRAKATS